MLVGSTNQERFKSVHSPYICSRTDEQMEQFYADLETTLDDIPKKDIVIIAGDWNAKVGSDNNGWESHG